jgi:putative iron-regulated protein
MKKNLLIICAVASLYSCKKDQDNNPDDAFLKAKTEAIADYGELVYTNYQESKTKALEMKSVIESFCANPTEAGFMAAKQAWLNARPMYLQTEAFRFYGGPIDDENGPEGLMNGWPLDENYIDYVEGNLSSGIINNRSMLGNITKDSLAILNEKGGETNLSTGYHAIEFLLWGQDLSETGAGNRPYTDFTTAPNADRRKQYILAASDLLIDHHNYLLEAWKPDANNFRKELQTLPEASINKIVNGLKELVGGESAGERMQVALTNQSQEDEHSCFSDNTHNDHKYDLEGIVNVYTGQFTRLNGSVFSARQSISSLVKQKNPSLDNRIVSEIQSARAAIAAIPVPFDRAIFEANGRQKIQTAIAALRALEASFQETFDLLNK